MERKKKKALVLFSGGLDSLLAVKLLQDQGIKADAICFISNFFDCHSAKVAANTNGVKIRKVMDISEEMLDLIKDNNVKKGKNLNPCIACHSLMISKADRYVESGEYDFLATGEVAGQRPFSQTKQALKEVQNNTKIKVLRPLSAKLLEPTDMEKKGWIDRQKLLDIQGRGRKKQISWAIYYNLSDYESPAGGCLLTESDFGKKLSRMIKHWPRCNKDDVELLKHGRTEWFSILNKDNKKGYVLSVTGRRKEDNVSLLYSKKKGDKLVFLKNLAGPLTLVRSKDYIFQEKKNAYKLNIPKKLEFQKRKNRMYKNERQLWGHLSLLTAWYKTESRGKEVEVKVKRVGRSAGKILR